MIPHSRKGEMKPYYQDEAVTIYHGDCRDILPNLPKVDVVFTDPPYNTGDIGKRHNQYSKGQCKKDDKAYSQFCHEWFNACIHLTENLVFTPGIAHIWEYPPARWVLCWYKPSSPSFSKLGGYNVWEPILYYGRYRKVIHDVFKQVPLNFVTEEWSNHPCPKPPALWAKLLNVISEPGETILDPFVGSGTTLRIAKNLGRKAIGIESKEEYCEMTVRRMAQVVFPL